MEHQIVTSGMNGIENVFSKYGITYIVTKAADSSGMVLPLINYLAARGDWELVFADGLMVVFVKSTPENRHIVEKHRVPKGILGNHIVAVGSTGELRPLAGQKARVIDAGGRSVLPGFNDAHVHWLSGGFSITNVNLRDASSPAELARRIGEFAKNLPKSRWILGGDWDHENFPGAPLPTKEMIDGMTPDHPVFVNRLDGHMALANHDPVLRCDQPAVAQPDG